MTDRRYRVALALLFVLLAAGNLALLSRYNIYVGDDGYLASYLFEYHFTGSRSFVLCADWPIHQFLVATLGAVYRWLYHGHLAVLELVDADYYRINALSATLFLVAFALYVAAIARLQNRWLVLACVLVFGTLEPFLVMSHSVRTESVMLLALAAAAYGLTRDRADAVVLGLLCLAAFVILNTHLGGWPLLAGLAVGTYYRFGARPLFVFLGGCAAAMAAYLLLNDLASPQALRQLVETYRGQGSISAYTRWHVLNDLASYFLEAKYKRHLIELLIVAGFVASLLTWRRLGKTARGLILTTISAFIAYIVIFSYINYYYLVYFYFLMLLTIAWAGNELLGTRTARVLAPTLAAPFVVLYAVIFGIFIRSPGWDALADQRDAVLQHLPRGGVVAAPEYFINVDPRNYRNFVPLAQAEPGSGCLTRHPDPRQFDAIVADTRQQELVAPYLSGFTLVERIRIGRLATRSISDDGELLVYTNNHATR
jgi:hypothetical protein